jgi:uncharacterized protein
MTENDPSRYPPRRRSVTEPEEAATPFRVLCLDGGGMRGVYQVAFLMAFTDRVHRRTGAANTVDIGKAFDLVVGTSTGGLVACALASGIPLNDVYSLYRNHGPHIFPFQLLRAIPVFGSAVVRPNSILHWLGDRALRNALERTFKSLTVGEMYASRNVPLAVPAIAMSRHHPVVFKTPHLTRLNGRDNSRLLVEICLATSAAPILRSMARIPEPGSPNAFEVYTDGGLWANNPGVIGVVEASEMLDAIGARTRPIHLFMLGNLPAQGGEEIRGWNLHRGALGWRFGLRALTASLDAQSEGYDYIANKVATLRSPQSFAYRFPAGCPSNALRKYLENMDDARSEAIAALTTQAVADADLAWSRMAGVGPIRSFHDAISGAPQYTLRQKEH